MQWLGGAYSMKTQRQIAHQFLDYQIDTSRTRVAVSKDIETAEGIEVEGQC